MATIAFRLDAGPSIGSGHLIRCTALAEALRRLGHRILFLCRNKLSYETLFPVVYFATPLQNSLDNHYHVQDITDELPELCRVLTEEQVDCIIVDHYGATETYFLRLKEEACLVAAIDDMKPHSFPVDVVINGNIYAERWSYPEAKCELLGSQYVLLRKEFQMNDAKTIHPSVKHIYITSGGADPLGFCLATLHWLSGICEAETEVFVIVGPDFAHSYVKQSENCLIKPVLCYHADMRACMDDADLFITSAGSTLYELAACGVPNLSCILVENQKFIGQTMHQYGYSCCVGKFENLEQQNVIPKLRRVLSDYSYRKKMSEEAQHRFMIDGANNVACFLSSMVGYGKGFTHENIISDQ